ncbi:MAG: hypothetical protein FDZ69_10760 [Deltaproteobacteria bacterium]|nr:MAG: hypothetical protein FDZ69_10760 [Deltaproteobacteria bacterium]
MLRFLRSDGMASDFAKALLGNVANSGSVFLATILLVRTFTQQEFASIGVALAYAFVLAKILDAGISFTALRFSARNGAVGEGIAYLGAMHLVIVGAAAVATILAGLPGQLLGRALGGDLVPGMALATVATAWAIAFHSAVRSQLQAGRSYNRLLFFQLLAAGVRLLLVAACWGKVLSLAVLPALLALYFYPIVVASLLVWREVTESCRGFMTLDRKSALLRGMFAYAPWVWIGGTLFVATLRVPIFALEQWGQGDGVAVFAAALSFVSLIALANDAARAVIIPRTSGFTTHADFESYFEKLRAVWLKAVCILVPILLASGGLVAALLPPAYLPDSIYVFYALASAMLVTSLLGAVTNLIHVLGRPQVEAAVNLSRALSCLAGSYFLLGCSGGGIVSLAVFCGTVVALFEVLLVFVVRRGIRSDYRV